MDQNKESNEIELILETKKYGMVKELWHFIKSSRKWWVIPILIIFLIFGILLALGQTGAAPFIYVLF